MLCSLLMCASLGLSEEPQNVEAIYKRAKEQMDRVHSIKVQYSVLREKVCESPSLRRGIFGTYDYTFVWDGVRARSGIQSSQMSRGESRYPLNPKTVISDGEYLLTAELGSASITASNTVQVDPLESYVSVFLNISYTAIHLADLDNSWFYPHCIRPGLRRTEYRLLKDREEFDGNSCLVVEHGNDVARNVLLVDPSIGCAIRRSELKVRKSAESPWYTDSVAELSDYHEVARDIWLPRVCRKRSYAPAGTNSECSGKPTTLLEVRVSGISVNDVADSDFAIALPPGTLIVSALSSEPIIVPGPDDLLLQKNAELLKMIVGKEPKGGVAKVRGVRFWLFVANIAFVVVILSLLAIRAVRTKWLKQ